MKVNLVSLTRALSGMDPEGDAVVRALVQIVEARAEGRVPNARLDAILAECLDDLSVSQEPK